MINLKEHATHIQERAQESAEPLGRHAVTLVMENDGTFEFRAPASLDGHALIGILHRIILRIDENMTRTHAAREHKSRRAESTAHETQKGPAVHVTAGPALFSLVL